MFLVHVAALPILQLTVHSRRCYSSIISFTCMSTLSKIGNTFQNCRHAWQWQKQIQHVGMPLGGAMGLKRSWKGWMFATCHCCVVYILLTLQRPFTHSCRCIPSAGIANNWTAWAVGVIVFHWITAIRNVLDTVAKEGQRPMWYTLWSCLLGLVNNHAQSLAWQVNMQKENLNYNS